ncbi:MAG: hypothetical protein PHS17_17605 [Desulfobacterales bacterium]|nr:hypothetical protein [Desulfobacterales bacterium]
MVRHLLPVAIGVCLLATCFPVKHKRPLDTNTQLTNMFVGILLEGKSDRISVSIKAKKNFEDKPDPVVMAPVEQAAPPYKEELKQWIQLNHGPLAAVLLLVFLLGIARAWNRERQRLLLRARALTPEEMGLLNVIRLITNRFWEIRKGKVVRLEEWRRDRE